MELHVTAGWADITYNDYQLCLYAYSKPKHSYLIKRYPINIDKSDELMTLSNVIGLRNRLIEETAYWTNHKYHKNF